MGRMHGFEGKQFEARVANRVCPDEDDETINTAPRIDVTPMYKGCGFGQGRRLGLYEAVLGRYMTSPTRIAL